MMTLMRLLVAGGFGVVASAAVADGHKAEIDLTLENGIDFRTVAFSECFERTECEVNGVRISAEHWDNDIIGWAPSRIYWSPIDGFGVIGGGQNDEIDFEERLIVEFVEPQLVDRVRT